MDIVTVLAITIKFQLSGYLINNHMKGLSAHNNSCFRFCFTCGFNKKKKKSRLPYTFMLFDSIVAAGHIMA